MVQEELWQELLGQYLHGAMPRWLRREADGNKVNVVWHKWSDLRLLDHEPLYQAHQREAVVLHLHLVELPLLIGSSRVSGIARCAARRREFWQESVEESGTWSFKSRKS